SRTPSRRAAKRSSRDRRSFRPPGFRSVSMRSRGFGRTERGDASTQTGRNAMNLMTAAALALVLSFVVFVIMAGWYVAPWLATRQRAEALTPLLWVHAFRHIALQIFSAQRFGFAVSDGARDQIAAGDVIGMILAVIAIVALHYRARIAPVLVWVFVAETVFDLINATIAGVREQLFATASGVTWLILTFYVPLLWVSLCLIVWQLARIGPCMNRSPCLRIRRRQGSTSERSMQMPICYIASQSMTVAASARAGFHHVDE